VLEADGGDRAQRSVGDSSEGGILTIEQDQ
jgi:hypothetical protein